MLHSRSVCAHTGDTLVLIRIAPPYVEHRLYLRGARLPSDWAVLTTGRHGLESKLGLRGRREKCTGTST